MRLWRVVSHAPGRPDSPSPALHRYAPSYPPPPKPHEIKSLSGVGIRAEFEFNKVIAPVLKRDLRGINVLALKLHAQSVQFAYEFASTRRALEKTSFNSHHQNQAWTTASNPPDPRLVSTACVVFLVFSVCGSAWDKVHKDSIRAALVPGRGSSTIRGSKSGRAGDVFSGTSAPCSRSLSLWQASIPLRDEPYLPLLRTLTQICDDPWVITEVADFFVGKLKGGL
eukprot:1155536-Pelagomonas_calceolata.AAC.1